MEAGESILDNVNDMFKILTLMEFTLILLVFVVIYYLYIENTKHYHIIECTMYPYI